MRTWWFYTMLFASLILYSVQIVLATLRLSAVILWPWYWIVLPLGIALIVAVVVSIWFLIVFWAMGKHWH